MNLPDSKFLTRLKEAIDQEDERAKEKMAGGMLQDFNEYCRMSGRRKALADAKRLAEETYEDIMKE